MDDFVFALTINIKVVPSNNGINPKVIFPNSKSLDESIQVYDDKIIIVKDNPAMMGLILLKKPNEIRKHKSAINKLKKYTRLSDILTMSETPVNSKIDHAHKRKAIILNTEPIILTRFIEVPKLRIIWT